MTKRLFVSVDLDAIEEGIAAVQDRLRDASGLTFVDPAQAHVTLKFLGDTDEDRVDPIVAALERATDESGVDPFTATIGGLGVFPSLDYVEVVWVGTREGGEQLTALHRAVEERTVEMGFDPADHEFTPHATLARMRHAGGKELVQSVVREADPTVGTATVDEVRLTESVLTDEGPEYETVASVPL